MVDDAPAMPARRRTLAAPAQVVESAALDAQQSRRLVDGEKGRVVIPEHEDLHEALVSAQSVAMPALWGGPICRGLKLHTRSAEQAAIAAPAKRLAALDIPAKALPQATPWPLAFDALASVDDDGSLSQAHTCVAAIQRDQRVTELPGQRAPRREPSREVLRPGKDAVNARKRLRGRADLAAMTEAYDERNRTGDSFAPTHDELHRAAARAQDDVLAADGVDKNVLDVGKRRDAQSILIAICLSDGTGREVQARGASLRQPDGVGLLGGQAAIGESSKGPTSRPARRGRAAE